MGDDAISHYLCIGCPLGCRLEVEEDVGGGIVEVRGWSCRKGERYGRQEHTDPRRVVTTTIGIDGADLTRLPVKTNAAVPKARVRDVCAALRGLRTTAPVRLGEIVAADIAGTGIDVVATRDLR